MLRLILSKGSVLKEGVLFRGGNIRLVTDLALIHNPKTILNLRVSKDPVFEGVTNYHLPEPNNSDVYHVHDGAIKKWILSCLKILTSDGTEFPALIHCAAGKDRAGVIVAAALTVVGVPRKIIMQDYSMSAGEIKPKLFSKALDTMQDERFFKTVDKRNLQAKLSLSE